MLIGVDPVLTGELLAHLDAMGHSDSVVVADAHFPTERLAARSVTLPGLDTPRVVRAVCSVLPLDDPPAVDLMTSSTGDVLDVQAELLDAAGIGPEAARFVDRYSFYEVAAEAFLIVRTGETRVYGNAVLRKGVVATTGDGSVR